MSPKTSTRYTRLSSSSCFTKRHIAGIPMTEQMPIVKTMHPNGDKNNSANLTDAQALPSHTISHWQTHSDVPLAERSDPREAPRLDPPHASSDAQLEQFACLPTLHTLIGSEQKHANDPSICLFASLQVWLAPHAPGTQPGGGGGGDGGVAGGEGGASGGAGGGGDGGSGGVGGGGRGEGGGGGGEGGKGGGGGDGVGGGLGGGGEGEGGGGGGNGGEGGSLGDE
mmetsp:Transcript_26109/g.64688  ORF Transcript_26109/g.64688 Transcript_26109/m.64688 type:complete len:225 (-) Transcript_26109:769-1443(-)